MLLQLAEEGAPGHPQQPGRLALVPPGSLQGVEQPVPRPNASAPESPSVPSAVATSARSAPGIRPAVDEADERGEWRGLDRGADDGTGPRAVLRPGWRISIGRSSSVRAGPSQSTTARSTDVRPARMFPGPVVGDERLDRLLVDVADRPADPLGVAA